MTQQYTEIGSILSDVESMIDIVPTTYDRIVQMAVGFDAYGWTMHCYFQRDTR